MATSFLPVTEVFILDKEGKKEWVPLYALFSTNPKELDIEKAMETVKLLQEQIKKGAEATGLLLKLKQFNVE